MLFKPIDLPSHADQRRAQGTAVVVPRPSEPVVDDVDDPSWSGISFSGENFSLDTRYDLRLSHSIGSHNTTHAIFMPMVFSVFLFSEFRFGATPTGNLLDVLVSLPQAPRRCVAWQP